MAIQGRFAESLLMHPSGLAVVWLSALGAMLATLALVFPARRTVVSNFRHFTRTAPVLFGSVVMCGWLYRLLFSF
jgi:hypothetical protein